MTVLTPPAAWWQDGDGRDPGFWSRAPLRPGGLEPSTLAGPGGASAAGACGASCGCGSGEPRTSPPGRDESSGRWGRQAQDEWPGRSGRAHRRATGVQALDLSPTAKSAACGCSRGGDVGRARPSALAPSPPLSPPLSLPGGLGLPVDRGGYRVLGDRVLFAYRATSFEVPQEWYDAYQADLTTQHERGTPGVAVGLVSSVTDFLDWAWSDLKADWDETGASRASWIDQLSCYNLPTTDMPERISARFWHGGWGPPYRVFGLTNVLVLSTARWISDLCSGTEVCEDFPDFVETMLRGGTARDRLGEGPCGLRFRFMNADPFHAFVAGTGATSDTIRCGSRAGETYACDEGFLMEGDTTDVGRDWDHAFPGSFDWTAAAWVTWLNGSHPSRSLSEPPKESGSARNYVSDGSWIFTSRPEHLAWHGFLCDWILYLARLAHDRARDRTSSIGLADRLALMRKAWELGRYALRILVWRGEILIHELGHVHAGEGGHCSKGSGCHELSAQRWRCAVIARYGLPLDSGNAAAADTWANTEWESVDTYVSGLSGTTTGDRSLWVAPVTSCQLAEPGDALGAYSFACSSCTDTDMVTERVLEWGS